MTWSVATPRCVAPFSIISSIVCSTPGDRPERRVLALVEAALAVEVTKQLVVPSRR